MLLVLLLLGVAPLLVLGADDAVPPSTTPATNPIPMPEPLERRSVTLVYDFEGKEPAPEVVAALKSELEENWRQSRVDFDWRPYLAIRQGDTFPDLVVVHFRGNCQAAPGFSPSHSTPSPSMKPHSPRWHLLVFLGPAVLIYGAFSAWPLIDTLRLGLYSTDSTGQVYAGTNIFEVGVFAPATPEITVEVGKSASQVAQLVPNQAAVVVGRDQSGIEAQRLVEISNGSVEVAKLTARRATQIPGVGVVGFHVQSGVAVRPRFIYATLARCAPIQCARVLTRR